MRISFLAQDKQKTNAHTAQVVFSADTDRDEVYRAEDGSATLSVGVKSLDTGNVRQFMLLGRRIISRAKQHRLTHLTASLDEALARNNTYPRAERVQMLVENMELANYQFVERKTKPKEGWPFVEAFAFIGKPAKDEKDAARRGSIIAREVNNARTLANMPGGDMTPQLLARKAREAVKGTKATVKVLSRAEMKRLGMGAVLGVAQGSAEAPQFIIVSYHGGGKQARPIVLAGKGVTFDTGGINLKPSDAILGMNMDMSGGAAVIHTVALAARLGIKQNVIALVPAVENMPSGSSYRPGDVLTSMSGKTIEVLNTDAEGRVILADALTYAKRYKPAAVIDVATLTGAAMVALGQRTSALFTADDALAEEMQKWGEESGDLVWRLPLWDEYDAEVKGTFGDVSNLHNKGSRMGGAIVAAAFLKQFTNEYEWPWAHIDIAPRMTAADDEYLSQGSVGAPVRLLLRTIENYTEH